MPIIEISNTSLAPWSEIHPRCRSSHINILRQRFKEDTAIRRNLRTFTRLFNSTEEANRYNTDLYRGIARDLSLSKNCFPPIRRTMDRVWRDYIFPCSTEGMPEVSIDIQRFDSRDVIQMLSDRIEFHKFYRDLRELKSKDFYIYKYCVILAGLNIIKKIIDFFSNPNFHPTSYVCLKDTLEKCVCSRFGSTSYIITIRPDVFLRLINLIPIFEINSHASNYYNFWDELWNVYYNSTYNSTWSDARPIVRPSNRMPLLTEEYFGRSDNKKSFISKEQIISMIETSRIPENALHSIYDIMQFINND